MRLMLAVFLGLALSTSMPARAGTSAGSLSITSYNVENLFDAAHDEGKDDWELLPKNAPGRFEACSKLSEFQAKKCLETDWTDEKVNLKINQIKSVIDKLPTRPAILGLVEVENETVVRRVANTLGYSRFFVTDSPDQRGIDVAVLFNESADLKFIDTKTHYPDFDSIGGKPSREILEVQFAIGPRGEKLSVLMNHWPSQGAKVQFRTIVAQTVAELATKLISSGSHVVVMGDFNVESTNDVPSPFAVFGDPAKNPLLSDVHALYVDGARANKLDVSSIAPGSYFYGNPGYPDSPPAMAWNLLDRFFVSQSLLKGSSSTVHIDLTSFRIFNPPEITTTYTYRAGPFQGTVITGIPKRYDHSATTADKAGFSDHFPIYMKFAW